MKNVGLFMKDLSQYAFIKDLSQPKQQFKTLEWFKICNCILLISECPLVLHIF